MNTQIRKLNREILEILVLGDRRLKTRLTNASSEIIELVELIDEEQGSISIASKELSNLLPRRNFAREIPTMDKSLVNQITEKLFEILIAIEKLT